jgi:hypothetical protein
METLSDYFIPFKEVSGLKIKIVVNVPNSIISQMKVLVMKHMRKTQTRGK